MDVDRISSGLGIAANVGVLAGLVMLAAEIRQNSEHLVRTARIPDGSEDLREQSGSAERRHGPGIRQGHHRPGKAHI